MENNTQKPVANNVEIIDLRQLFFKYLRNWYWFVISGIVCISVALLYIKVVNPKFSVQSSIMLRQEKASAAMAQMAFMESLGMGKMSKDVEDEIEILKSKTILANAIVALSLENECFEKQGLRKINTYPHQVLALDVPGGFNSKIESTVEINIKPSANGFTIKYKDAFSKNKYNVASLDEKIMTPVGEIGFIKSKHFDAKKQYTLKAHPLKNITESYSTQLNIAPVNKKSNAIRVSIVDENVTKAKDLINKLIELYNLDAVVDKNMIANNSKNFVDDRLELITRELMEVEVNVENFKRVNKLTDISSEAEVFLKSSSEYNKAIAEVETQLNLVTYIESYVKDVRNQYNLIPANLGITDESLIGVIKVYNEALLERMKMLRSTNEQNPVITQMEQQLNALRAGIVSSISSVKDGLRIAKNDLLNKESQFISKIKQVPTQEREFIEIKRQQEIKQQLYLFLLQKREENALTLASTIPSAKTIDAAYASLEPESPKLLLVLALALVLAFVFPIGGLYVYDLFNNKISDRKEYQRLVKAPYLGSIGVSKDADRIVVREGRTTPIVEMFRMVRTNLQFLNSGQTAPVTLITSSIGGEGKSFTAINLAMSMALMKKKVILIGLDIRKPMLGEYLHISKNKGVTMYLADNSYSLKDIIIPSGIHNYLDVIPAGPVPPNPAELLMSTRLEEMIAELKTQYDYIIIDSAPVGVVSDTYLINRVVDNSVYVSRMNYSPKDVVELINEVYADNRLNKLAVVLNGVGEGVGYGYGYGYGAKN